MTKLNVQNVPQGIDGASVNASVEAFATTNPLVSAEMVTLDAKDEQGADVQLQGSYTRTPLGEVVFMILSVVGRKVIAAVRERRASRRTERLAERNERRVARGKKPLAPGERTVVGKIIADTVDALFDLRVKEKLIAEIAPGTFTVVGGRTYRGKEAVLQVLQEELDAQAKAEAKAAPKKAAKKAPAKAVGRKEAKATKKATPKKAAGKK
jgi:hypothetical protein